MHPDDRITAVLLRQCWIFRTSYIQCRHIPAHPCPILTNNPSYAGSELPVNHKKDIFSALSLCPRPQRGGPQHKTAHTKAASFSFSPTFFSLTHTHSLFSSPSKKMPKDRSKKMNRSQRLSWQQRAEATCSLDQQKKLTIKALIPCQKRS